MKLLNKTLLFLVISGVILFAQEKKVLVEIFTNSFCPLCPPAHSTLDNYLQSGNGNKIEYIYYHMSFPYPQDELNIHNKNDASAKNNFYGPISGTPKAFFNGQLVTNSYSNWSSQLDNLVSQQSDFSIELTGNYTDNDFTVQANVTLLNNVSPENLTINFVVVEDVNYTGGNGISNHKNVMRKIANPEGDNFTITFNETKTLNKTFSLHPDWNSSNLKVVVFIQNKSTKEVFQSSSINFNEFNLTSINEEKIIQNKFQLFQNYPNPFNPTTTITYSIPFLSRSTTNVLLTVYNVLGKKVATLVNQNQKAGIHQITFDASNLPSGQYFYQLKAGNYSEVKKLILVK